MIRRTLVRGVLMGLLTLAMSPPVDGIGSLSVTSGAYLQNINAANLQGGAGTDLTSTYTSAAGATTLDVTGFIILSLPWHIDVRRIDSAWNSSLVLSVRRTSSGAACGLSLGSSAPTGGDVFQVIATSATTFLNGNGNRCGVGIQYQLSGVSVQVPPGSYATTVQYTYVQP